MSMIRRWRVTAAVALAAGASLLLSACIVSPGTFSSTLDLRRNGTFTYTYEGQIYLMALSQLAEMAQDAERAGDAFIEQPCYDDDTFEERSCSAEEIEEQRAAWEENAQSRSAAAEREAAAMRAMLGGIDPADPEAAEELAERLRRQEGWQAVEYRGDGLFEVRFALTSRVGHDFAFPTFERFPMSNSFVVANLRQGRTVRIDAPGFAAQGGGNPFQGMMTGMAGMFGAVSEETGGVAMPEMAGTFRIVTDGRILANNTDNGPAETATGQVLEWSITQRTQAAPMALIGID
jgi:hypothetical protein